MYKTGLKYTENTKNYNMAYLCMNKTACQICDNKKESISLNKTFSQTKHILCNGVCVCVF